MANPHESLDGTPSSVPRIGLIGFGYWGPNLLRNLVLNGQCAVSGVLEPNPASAAKCQAMYPHVPVYTNLAAFLREAKLNGAVIATPPSTHFELAAQCLEAELDVLVEKPLALSVEDCNRILRLAERQKRLVMVDHTFVYNPAVECMAHEVASHNIGDLLYYDSVRVNLGGFQSSANVLWDLAPHDFSILDLLTQGAKPLTISATGCKHFSSPTENLCYVNIRYPNNMLAHLHLNWAAPLKIRTITLGGSKKMIIYDDNHPVEKIRIYDRGVSINAGTESDLRIDYRTGDMLAPAIANKEALASVIRNFVNSMNTRKPAPTDGESGRRIVAMLEAASQSMAKSGEPVSPAL